MSNEKLTNIDMTKHPHKIQVTFNRVEETKLPKTLAELVRITASPTLVLAFDELERLVGLNEAKKTMYEIYALFRINAEREKHQLKREKQMYHMVFKGNPGTGKTTVARIISKIFKELGVLSKGHMIECERADLVGEFIGHTAQKTKELIKRAMGGVLFIDEAYSLARGGEKDFGKEAIDCLTKSLEDQGNDFICILAGYTEEMESFLELNPGLPSRFPIRINFVDYSVDELMSICEQIAKDKQYELSRLAMDKIKIHLTKITEDPFNFNFSNGRYIRNLIEKAIRVHSVRLLSITNLTKEDLLLLKAEDFTM